MLESAVHILDNHLYYHISYTSMFCITPLLFGCAKSFSEKQAAYGKTLILYFQVTFLRNIKQGECNYCNVILINVNTYNMQYNITN